MGKGPILLLWLAKIGASKQVDKDSNEFNL